MCDITHTSEVPTYAWVTTGDHCITLDDAITWSNDNSMWVNASKIKEMMISFAKYLPFVFNITCTVDKEETKRYANCTRFGISLNANLADWIMSWRCLKGQSKTTSFHSWKGPRCQAGNSKSVYFPHSPCCSVCLPCWSEWTSGAVIWISPGKCILDAWPTPLCLIGKRWMKKSDSM